MNKVKYKKISGNTSFIMTVYNESGSIGAFLESLMGQTHMPSELIIVDGGSSDDTVGILIRYFSEICGDSYHNSNGTVISGQEPGRKTSPDLKLLFKGFIDRRIKVRIIGARGAGISQGRNIAIENADNDLICVSDGGCILEKNWLHEITKNSSGTGTEEIEGGYTYPYARKVIQAALAVCVLPKKNEINAEKFMPSSRNISFKKDIWKKVGGYPENMDFGEDMKFNFNIRSAGYRIKFNPGAEVYWDLRDNLKAIFKQFFRYAKGDAIGRIYSYRHLIRFVTLLAFLGIIIISIIYSPLFLVILPFLFALYCYRPYLRINYFLENKKSCIFIKNERELVSARCKTIFLIPFLLPFIDLAKLSGYIYGFLTRRAYSN